MIPVLLIIFAIIERHHSSNIYVNISAVHIWMHMKTRTYHEVYLKPGFYRILTPLSKFEFFWYSLLKGKMRFSLWVYIWMTWFSKDFISISSWFQGIRDAKVENEITDFIDQGYWLSSFLWYLSSWIRCRTGNSPKDKSECLSWQWMFIAFSSF